MATGRQLIRINLFSDKELALVGVKGVDGSEFGCLRALQCVSCDAKWSPNVKRIYYWKCPNGCNHKINRKALLQQLELLKTQDRGRS